MHGRSVATCFNLALFKFRQLVSEELEFVVVTHDHLIQSMEDAMKLMRAGGMLMTKHVSLPLQPHQVRFGTAPPPPYLAHVPRVASGRTLRPRPGACATRGLRPHAPAPCLAYVPRVASHRTLRPPCLALVPRVASHRTLRPPAGRMYHAWPNFARSSSCS